MFPRTSGLSSIYGPRVFMQQHYPDYKSMCRLEFGAYCKVHDDPSPSNTMTSRTTSAIALYPANNQQGGYYFMSIARGKLLSRYQWTELPIPDNIIQSVNDRGKKDRQLKEGDTVPAIFEFSIRNSDGVITLDTASESIQEAAEADAPATVVNYSPVHTDLEAPDNLPHSTSSLPPVHHKLDNPLQLLLAHLLQFHPF